MGVGRERAGAWCVGCEEPPRKRGERTGVDMVGTVLRRGRRDGEERRGGEGIGAASCRD